MVHKTEEKNKTRGRMKLDSRWNCLSKVNEVLNQAGSNANREQEEIEDGDGWHPEFAGRTMNKNKEEMKDQTYLKDTGYFQLEISSNQKCANDTEESWAGI